MHENNTFFKCNFFCFLNKNKIRLKKKIVWDGYGPTKWASQGGSEAHHFWAGPRATQPKRQITKKRKLIHVNNESLHCYINSDLVFDRPRREAHPLLPPDRGVRGGCPCGGGVENGGLWSPGRAMEGLVCCCRGSCCASLPVLELLLEVTVDLLPWWRRRWC